MLCRASAILVAALLMVSTSTAQAQTRRFDIPAPPQPPGAITLKTSTPLANTEVETWTMSGADNVPVVQNVSVPTLTPFLPTRAKATGTAVIIAPGGVSRSWPWTMRGGPWRVGCRPRALPLLS